jgi:hypothetical protein
VQAFEVEREKLDELKEYLAQSSKDIEKTCNEAKAVRSKKLEIEKKAVELAIKKKHVEHRKEFVRENLIKLETEQEELLDFQ